MAWTPPASDDIVSPTGGGGGWMPPASDSVNAPHPAAALGQALYDAIHHAVRAASPFQPGPILETAAAGAPEMGKGFARVPAAPDAGNFAGAMNEVGRQLPVAVGALGAGMAAPVLAPAAAAAAPLLTSAAATGIGAAAANTGQQILGKAAGGDVPKDIPSALAESGKVGLVTALTDLGVGGLAKGVQSIAPKIVANFKSFPSEALKRTLERPDDVMGVIANAKNPQVAAETQAVQSLRQVQNSLTAARQEAGQQVDSALQAFQKATNGAKVISAGDVADAGAEALANRTTEEGMSALGDSEAKKIGDLVKQLSDAGDLSARDAVLWRQKLDGMINYKRGAVPEIQSGQGQYIIAQMAKQLRDKIGEAADKAGFSQLADANKNFSQIAQTYDAYRPAFMTKTQSAAEAVRKLSSLMNTRFYPGGLPQQELLNLGQAIPQAQAPMDRLLDAMAAREFTLPGKGSPSGVTMTAMRALAGPSGLARLVVAARGNGAAVRSGMSAVAGMTAARAQQ